MNQEMFGAFLRGGVITCLAMAILSLLFRWKKFGPAALVLSAAFGIFGLLLHGLAQSWPENRLIGIGVVLVILLAADAMLRSNADLKK